MSSDTPVLVYKWSHRRQTYAIMATHSRVRQCHKDISLDLLVSPSTLNLFNSEPPGENVQSTPHFFHISAEKSQILCFSKLEYTCTTCTYGQRANMNLSCPLKRVSWSTSHCTALFRTACSFVWYVVVFFFFFFFFYRTLRVNRKHFLRQ